MSSTKRKQNNPTKSASDIKKKARVSRSAKAALALAADHAGPSLARSRPQRKIIPKRPLSPDIELSSRRKRRKKKKTSSHKAKKSKAKSHSVSLGTPNAVHIAPDEVKPPKLSKQQKASLRKKKKRKKKTFVFPILAADRIPREQAESPKPSKMKKVDLGKEGPTTEGVSTKSKSKKKSKFIARNVLDIGELRVLPADELVRRFAKHTSFKVPSEDSNKATQKQHVYMCRMLPHYCSEKFYGNEEDTKRQITKHLLRHVGELLTVTNKGLSMTPQVKKVKQKKHLDDHDQVVEPERDPNSTMYILPSAPRPMRITLPDQVSSRMKSSSYTVIRSGEGDNEFVLLHKGRIVGLHNTASKTSKSRQNLEKPEDVEEDEDYEEQKYVVIDDKHSALVGQDKFEIVVEKRENVSKQVDDISALQLVTSVKMEVDGESMPVDLQSISLGDVQSTSVANVESTSTADAETASVGLSIESLAKAVEALVSKENQNLNIQAAEALANELSSGEHSMAEKEETATKAKLSLPGTFSLPPSSSFPLPKEVKGKKGGKVRKLSLLPAVLPVQRPYPDHTYAFGEGGNEEGSPHLDSDGKPMDDPQVVEEPDSASSEGNLAAETVNDELNRLMEDAAAPQSQGRVYYENVEPVVGEGANVTVEHADEEPESTQKKIKLRIVPSEVSPSEEIRKMALLHLQMLTKDRRKKGPFECQICHKNLTAASTLRAHYRSHAGIKPYQCEQCQATFTRLHSLKYHTMIHNKEARFLCSYCNRQFRHSSHYREHLRRHTGEEPFGCSDCSARFKTRNTYKRHLRSKHGKVVAENGKINLAPPDMFGISERPDTPDDIKSESMEYQPEEMETAFGTESVPGSHGYSEVKMEITQMDVKQEITPGSQPVIATVSQLMINPQSLQFVNPEGQSLIPMSSGQSEVKMESDAQIDGKQEIAPESQPVIATGSQPVIATGSQFIINPQSLQVVSPEGHSLITPETLLQIASALPQTIIDQIQIPFTTT